MDLNERKRKILQTIIDEYIGTAEPVGSRAISKKNELGLSSATIRNEMADLEEMGFLVQPHTSAGRVPSDAGYRFYVNSLMQRYQMSLEALQSMQTEFQKKVTQLEKILKKASMLTSAMTDYTSIVSTPSLNKSEIKKIDLVALGSGVVMLILVTKDGVVKSQALSISLQDELVNKLAIVLNQNLIGLSIDEITFDKIQELQSEIHTQLELHPKTLIEILNFIYNAVESLDETEIYINNAKSILKYPEYSDMEKAQEMFGFLEDQKNLKNLITKQDNNSGISITIGTENIFKELHDCSLITVNYSLDGNVIGKLGVIGPKRMNYAKVVASLDCISTQINKILHDLYTESE